MTRCLPRLLMLGALGFCAAARAQDVVRSDEALASQRPEAWAMRYFTAATTMTAFGVAPDLQPGEVRLGLELGAIPRLDAAQRQVGFNGLKREDLNKVPVFGRARAWVGLPGRLVAELGYTPPLEINGARARDLLAVALSRRLLERGDVVLSARLLGQHGAVEGDITCPADLAGDTDPVRNPYACGAPSRDRMELASYGAEATLGGGVERWPWHATLGVLRMEPEVQVDALTFGFRDRSRLTSRGNQSYLAVGAGHVAGPWQLRVELLYVPLRVQRMDDARARTDALVSLRVQLARDVVRR